MASSKLIPSAFSSGDLPPDALYEILLRVPAKDLCRLCAVCKAWRALTSDPLFAAAHKSCHKAVLLALAYTNKNGNGVNIMDLSGNVLKRIPSTGPEITLVDSSSGKVFKHISNAENGTRVLPAHLDLVCFTREYSPMGLCLLNPATGATLTLPACLSEELAREPQMQYCLTKAKPCAFGRVSSTGEYKVLRITRLGDEPYRQLCEVITVDGTNHGRWRGKQSPSSSIGSSDEIRWVVVDGVVYFLIDFFTSYCNSGVITVEPGSITSFNLETEEWMGTLRGPAPVLKFIQESTEFGYIDLNMQLSLAELNGFLVTVHNVHWVSMDLWFLTDIEKGIWVKKYSLPSQVAGFRVRPFLISDDGRILFKHGNRYLKGYDPRTGTYADAMEVRDCRSIAIYTGNLLSL